MLLILFQFSLLCTLTPHPHPQISWIFSAACFGVVFLLNGLMWTVFVNALQASPNSVEVSVLNTTANFLSSVSVCVRACVREHVGVHVSEYRHVHSSFMCIIMICIATGKQIALFSMILLSRHLGVQSNVTYPDATYLSTSDIRQWGVLYNFDSLTYKT